MWVLAQRGFDTMTDGQVTSAIVVGFASEIGHALIVYAVCSAAMDSRWRALMYLSFTAYVFWFAAVALPSMGISGPYGPAHIVLQLALWPWLFFGLALLAKLVLRRTIFLATSAASGPSPA